MSIKTSISDKLAAISNTEFQYIETNDISKLSELDTTASGIYMEASVIYFGIKNLAYIIKENGRRKTVQTYDMYHAIITEIAASEGGFVNCYSPEGFLIILPGNDADSKNAVNCGWKIAHAITSTFKDHLSLISGIEFSMGIDHGHIMGNKNLSDNGLEHLSWFGPCICKAIRISMECLRPFYVGISSIVFHNLPEDMITTTRRILGIKKTVEYWSRVSYQFENTKKHLYQTNHKIDFEEQ